MEENLKITCLHDRHVRLGAKMSPFAGFDMPIQYSGIADEHNAVRTACGIFDVSHMGEIFVSGKDSLRFVNHIFTNDVTGLVAGKILYGMMLYPDGGTVDDLLVYKEPEADRFLLVVNAANIDKDFEWLKLNSKDFDVCIDNRSEEWGQVAVQGPDSESVLIDRLGLKECASLGFYEFCHTTILGSPVILSRTGYTGEDGFEIYAAPHIVTHIWDTLLNAGVKPCGLGCRDTLRFEAGLPLYGDELSPEISPVMAGLSMFCKLDKQEFIGKEALVAQKTGGVPRKLVGIRIEDRAIPRAGYPVLDASGAEVGVVTTGYHSISLDVSICFALIDSSMSALGTPVQIQIRHKQFPGEVVKKRFYQTNYKK